MNEFEFESLSELNSLDNDTSVPVEVSMFQRQDSEPECFEKLLVTTAEEGMIIIEINGNLD